jgi:hypothetical protein
MLRRPVGAVVNRFIPTSRLRRGWRFAWSSISGFAKPKAPLRPTADLLGVDIRIRDRKRLAVAAAA